MRYEFGGLIFGGAYTWRGLFSEFYGMICRELEINKFHCQRATQEPYDFIYVDKPKKRVAKNFNEIIMDC